MRKIILVIDDFKELLGFENFLRRLGFDVLSLGKDILINDALLRFVPDIVIANFKSRSVDGLRLAQRLKKQVPQVRMALLHPTGAPPVLPLEASYLVDAWVEMPYQPKSVIRMISQFAGIDSQALLEKYGKISSAKLLDDAEKSVFVTEGEKKDESGWDPQQTPGKSATIRSIRSDRYEQFLREHDEGPADGVLPHDRAQAAMEQLKKDALSDKDVLEKINAEKRAFVETLFTEKVAVGGKGKK